VTTNSEHNKNNDETESELALVAGQLLAAMPPRMPQRLQSPSGCGWCGDQDVNERGQADGWRYKQADPAAWVLHVLREHLRGLLGEARAHVSFNAVGGVTVVLHDAYPEDVALFRDALGVQLACVLEFENDCERRCTLNFGGDPFARDITMVWYTTPGFVRLAAQLAAVGFYPTP
jgi:hypothetical protein